MSHLIRILRQWASTLKQQIALVYAVARSPELPWYCRAWWWLTLAYALSPIDLIPDFIPLLGFVDDVILLPIMIALGIRMTPRNLFDQIKSQAPHPWPKASKTGMILILCLWALALYWVLATFIKPI